MANIFSHFTGCSLSCWWFPLLGRNFAWYYLLICSCFCWLSFLSHIQKYIAKPDSSLMFASRSLWFQILQIFNPFFEWVIVYRARQVYSYILGHVSVQFSQHHLLKSCLLPILCSCLLYCQLIWLISGLYILLIHWSIMFFASTYCLDDFGLLWWLSGKESCKCRRHGFNPWVEKIPRRRKWQPTVVVLPGKCDGQRSLSGYSPWGCKSRTWLSN